MATREKPTLGNEDPPQPKQLNKVKNKYKRKVITNHMGELRQ